MFNAHFGVVFQLNVFFRIEKYCIPRGNETKTSID